MIKQWLKTVINIGTDGKDVETVRRIQSVNFISIAGANVVVGYIVFLTLMGVPAFIPIVQWDFLFFPAYLLPLYLGRFLSPSINGALLITITFLNLLITVAYAGASTGAHFLFLALPVMAVLFLKRDQWWLIALFVLMASAAILFIELKFAIGIEMAGPLSETMTNMLMYTNATSTILIIVFIVWYYRELVTEAEVKALGAHQKTRSILHTVLPRVIADKLATRDDQVIADRFSAVTILFADIVDFTARSKDLTPEEVVGRLDRVFSTFDELASKHGLEKIKTIGDCYMLVGGVPEATDDHADRVVNMALAMQEASSGFSQSVWPGFQIRIGIHTGPAVAGVIGKMKYAYDVWGDTVNIASRLEEAAKPGEILLSEETRSQLTTNQALEGPLEYELKGRGKHNAWRIPAGNTL